MRLSPWMLLLSASMVVAGCASDDGTDGEGEGDDPATGSSSEAVSARWQPAATHQTGTIEEGGPWNGGRACAGSLKPGAQSMKKALQAKFGIKTIDGYACRQNTANASQLSMHGTGRALDIFVSKKNGDTVANYIVTHANELGFQLVIWNRTLWKVTSGGGASRAYGGPNPHTDHIHAELTRAAATSAGAVDAPDDPPAEDPVVEPPTEPSGGGQACASDGQCNPGNDGSGLICSGGQCVPGCRSNAQCPGTSVCRAGQCS